MYSGLNNKLSNVPTITGLSDVTADSVTTDTLIVDGNDVGSIIVQVPINTANIATLQQITTGQTYASVGDTTTFDNNVTLGAGKTMTADNFTGLASNSSQVLVTDNNTANTYYPTFASTGTGQKSLLFDISTTPLSYFPSTSTLSATNFTAGTNVTTPNILSLTSITPSNARSILLNGTPIGNGGNTSTICMGTNAGPSGTTPNNCFCFGTNSGANLSIAGGFQSGVQNLCIGANSGNQLTYGKLNTFLGASAARFTTTGSFNTQIGGQSQTYPDNNSTGSYNTTIGAESYIAVDGLSFSTAIGAGTMASTSNTIQIGRNVDNTIFDGTITLNNDLILDSVGYTLTPTILSYLDGATSNIQAQINSISTGSFVTTNTNQTITGLKNFEGQLKLSGAGVLNASNVTKEFTSATNYKISHNVNNGTMEFWLNTTAGVSSRLLYLNYPATNLGTMYLEGYQIFTGNSGVTNFGHTTSTNFVIDNQNISGTTEFLCKTSGGVSQNVLTLSTSAVTFNNNNITLGAGNINFGAGAGNTSNLILGQTNAKSVIFTTGGNTLIGRNAGNAMTAAAENNTYIGSSAAVNATNSVQNTCVGGGAGTGITSGLGANTFVGYLSGFQTANGTGSNNVCIGALSGTAMTTTATSNVMVGSLAGTALTTGVRNTLVGAGASDSIISGNDNTIVGQGSGTMILTGLRNTIIGSSSGNTITGNDNICIGSAADVPTAANSNQIVIGRVNETMYIQGGFNWRIGPQIVNTTTGTLNAAGFVLAQFYIVNMSAASQTIALPNPTNAAYKGARVTFKRKGVTTPFLISSGGGISFVSINSITLAASPITIGATIFQVDLVSDGINWCIIGQA